MILSNNVNKEIKICINSSFTAKPLEGYLKHLGTYYNCKLSLHFTPVNQVLQEMIQSRDAYDVCIILFRIEDMVFESTSVTAKDESNLKQLMTTFIEIVKEFSVNRSVVVPIFPVSDLFDQEYKKKLEQITAYSASELKRIPHIQVPDLANLAKNYCLNDLYDKVAYKEAWIPYREAYYAILSLNIFRYVVGFVNNPFKLILVDCDNTLWKGVCGEEGPLGVVVEEPYRQLQKMLLKKSREGFLLGIISKNNEQDVWDVLEKNKGMVLKKSDFIAYKINWINKPENIRSLVKELNLGLESVIFIDDDIKECAEVIEGCPQVFTLLLPGKAELIPDFMEWNWAFDKFKITREDIVRTETYKTEHLRVGELGKAKTVKEFLEGLHIQVSFRRSVRSEIARLSQLTYRTNQFNVSTIRRAENELDVLFSDARYACFTVEVADKFSSYGIVGFLITTIEEKKLLIETFLLSCRALGRAVEYIILVALKKYCIENSLDQLQTSFFPTTKNQPVLDFLEKAWVKEKQTDACTEFLLDIKNIDEQQFPGTLHYKEPLKYESKASIGGAEHNFVEANDRAYAPVSRFWHNQLKTGHLTHKNYYLPFELQDHLAVSNFFKGKNDNDRQQNSTTGSQIETILMDFPGITKVNAISSGTQDRQLSVYYMADQNISTLKLRRFLNERIRLGASISFIQVHSPTDWLTHSAGSAINASNDTGSTTHTHFENLVIKVWQDALDGREVSINDNFFDIGGNSYQIVKVISRLETRYNIRPTFKDFFNNTLRQFCSNLSKDFADEIAKIG